MDLKIAQTGAMLCVPENTPSEVSEVARVPVSGRYVRTAKVAKIFTDCDYLIDVSHFKGHLMTGFGGAIKNISMGCASREGKLEQHGGVLPRVNTERCVVCGACVAFCPVDAVSLINEKVVIDEKLCIGCASCLAACNYGAMDMQ